MPAPNEPNKNDGDIARALERFPLGALCNAHPGVRAMRPAIAKLFPGARLCGPARTVKIPPRENAAIHRAVHAANPGDVLVVDAGGDASFGPFGDILAACCQNRGVKGVVIDGAVRDAAEIRELNFPVFCLGANPMAARKTHRGEIDLEISCGGVQVRPGDFIVGDDDGVVVAPREIASPLIGLAQGVLRREEKIKAQLAAGLTTCDVFGINP